jgi:hypothetical protein
MDLDADIRAEMLKYLPVPDRETASMLADMPTGRLLDCFLKWRDRLVHPHPRALRIAADLQANPRFAALEQDVRMIWQSAVHGENLAPYLGRGARFAYLHAPQRPRDLNALLNNWDIHWLNISNQIEKDGYVRRADTLLFVIFTDETAYFLDLMPRGRWNGKRLVETALRNWPDDGLFHKLPGSVPAPAAPAPGRGNERARGRARLSRDGSDEFVVVDGEAYVSNAFGVADGSSPARITVMSMKLQGLLRYYAENPGALERELKAANERFGIDWPLILQFRLIVARTSRGYEFVIIESMTSTMMALGV